MASRMASRFAAYRRFSSGGKILGEEEKAAENIYIKKAEKEKLEKLAHKGPKPEEATASSGASVTDSKPIGSTTASGASTEKVSTDKYRNYAVVAGVITAFGAVGWYLRGTAKKPEVQED